MIGSVRKRRLSEVGLESEKVLRCILEEEETEMLGRTTLYRKRGGWLPSSIRGLQ